MKRFLLMMTCLLAMVAQTADFKVTENHKPLAEIVVPKAVHPTVMTGAKELSTWIEYISGAKLEIREGEPSADKPAIVLTVNPDFAAEDLKAIGTKDGYAVRQRGPHLYIIATRGKGILNGVYRFLQKNTDIIWARPNKEFGTIATPNPTIVFTETNYVDVPKFIMRGWQCEPFNQDHDQWLVRQQAAWTSHMDEKKRLHTEWFDDMFICHAAHNTIRLYLPESKYYKDHPDFYAMLNGERVRPSSKGSALTQLCYTNKAMTEEFIKNFDSIVDKNPDYSLYGICEEDNLLGCECPACSADITLPDGRVIKKKDNPKVFTSTRFFIWVNAIARHLKERHPGKGIKTNGYFLTEAPPEVQLEENIITSYAPIFKNSKISMEHPDCKEVLSNLITWSKRSDKVMHREYYGLQKVFPRPIDGIAMQDWRAILKHSNITRTYSEMVCDMKNHWDGIQCWDMNAPIYWCLANGPWDPDVDVETLRTQFFTRVYGEAAKDMADFYHAVEKVWLTLPGRSSWMDNPFSLWAAVFRRNPELKATLDAFVASAAGKKMPPNGRIMFDRFRAVYEEIVNSLPQYYEYPVTIVSAQPPFDPFFANAPWKDAVPMNEFKDEVRIAKEYKEKTDVRVLADKDNLYVGCRCTDDFGFAVNAMPYAVRREVWPTGDKLEICIGVNEKDIYQFAVDCNGNYCDLLNRKAEWQSHASIYTAKDAKGWSLMVVIPLKDLKTTLDGKVSMTLMRYLKDKQNKSRGIQVWRFGVPNSVDTFVPLKFKK